MRDEKATQGVAAVVSEEVSDPNDVEMAAVEKDLRLQVQVPED